MSKLHLLDPEDRAQYLEGKFIYPISMGDIDVGHQHHNMPECDVGDRYVMLESEIKPCAIFNTNNYYL